MNRGIDLRFNDETQLQVLFSDGKLMQYDMKNLFDEYPIYMELKDRKIFTSGKLVGYGIIWTDDIDIAIEEIYDNGIYIRNEPIPGNLQLGEELAFARAEANMSQHKLSQLTGIDQSDISKIERGMANPSFKTLCRLADGLNLKCEIRFVK